MHQKIKIMYVMDHFYKPTGGTEGQVLNLVQNLNKERFYTELCVFRYNSDFFLKNVFPCPVKCLNISSFYDLRSVFKLISFRKYLIKRKFDIVQTFFNETAMTLPFLLRGSGIKVIGSRRDMGFWYTKNKLFILRLANRYVHKYLVNSYAVKDNVIRNERVNPGKINVIYNGHDLNRFEVEKTTEFFNEHNIPIDSIIIGIVANLRPVKRVGDLIIAFKKIAEKFKNAVLVSIGHHGCMLQDYKKLAETLDLGNRIKFIGNTNNVLPVVKNFEVGVICSESEGLSNTIIEYMGCGVPVVATKTGGNVELVNHCQTGMLVNVGDPDELGDTILKIVEDKKLQKTLTKNAISAVKINFSIEKNICEHEIEYANMLVEQTAPNCRIRNRVAIHQKGK